MTQKTTGDLEEERKLDDIQFGFRKGRGTIDAILLLKSTIDNELKKETGKVWTFIAELKGAFDRVKREAIWKEMEKMEVEEKVEDKDQRIIPKDNM